MDQTVTLQWREVARGQMPKAEGTYLVAWSDGSVESYPISDHDILSGQIKSGCLSGELWCHSPVHPDYE